MSIIENLKLSQKQRPTDLPPEHRLRIKMSEALDKQITAAIHDAGEGPYYERYEIEEFKNPETGEIETRKVKKRFTRWWWVDINGDMFLSLRYGNKPLEIKPKKTSIEINDDNHLVDVLKALQAAVLSGELDQQLQKAANARKAQFASRKTKAAS